MAKKKYIFLRLYRIHDQDLILLYHNKDFGFAKAIRQSLKAYANKEPCFFLPPPTENVPDDYNVCSVRVSLDPVEDADIINLLKKAKPRKINSMVKAVLRGSMLGVYAYGDILGGEYKKYTQSLHDALMNEGCLPLSMIHEYPTKNKKALSAQKKAIKSRSPKLLGAEDEASSVPLSDTKESKKASKAVKAVKTERAIEKEAPKTAKPNGPVRPDRPTKATEINKTTDRRAEQSELDYDSYENIPDEPIVNQRTPRTKGYAAKNASVAEVTEVTEDTNHSDDDNNNSNNADIGGDFFAGLEGMLSLA